MDDIIDIFIYIGKIIIHFLLWLLPWWVWVILIIIIITVIITYVVVIAPVKDAVTE